MGISCSDYDLLEIASMRGEKLSLFFEDVDKNQQVIEGVVDTLYTKNGEEFVVLKNGDEYPLSQLRSIKKM
ncbi:hypothetical protein THMIRHAM_01640 [Thiomicrorhabdus immobilis]|uniref:Rho-binding antiterminator n=1 Tax=Thiomicrorhabdus immobilis TaxID=2791037 RepID=A0ABN6CV19_9GAMM|nr:Rho-binding antiterminator [Thiomicrorhabdus immobilis]BCN92379.1 hypothetical protein THMIRHAM_01640 [Thiomicrorhabdus immobilis]